MQCTVSRASINRNRHSHDRHGHLSSSVWMSDILEYTWESLSRYIDLRTLEQLLAHCNQTSRSSYNRCRCTVLCNIFVAVHDTIKHLLESGVQPESIVTQVLPSGGYIPHVDNDRTYTNDILGFLDERNKWVEWKTVSISTMRSFWDTTLPSRVLENASVRAALQSIVELVPTVRVSCRECAWDIPMNSMYSEELCCYCHDQTRVSNPLHLHIR